MTINYDLHTHSTASDGAYTPTELVQQAARSGIDALALTDHDTTSGLKEAMAAGSESGIQVIAGLEISVSWNKKTIHLIGLNIDPEATALQKGIEGLQEIRADRAIEMGRRLEKAGIPGIYQAAKDLAGSGMVTRTHFAHALAGLGLAVDVRDVFKRYLTPGKPGYVNTTWAEMGEAINWIKSAGGVTVLAHPQRYNLTGSCLRRLVLEFRDEGGLGLDVLSGVASPGEVQSSTEYAKRYELLASCGSDFHSPQYQWPKLGRMPRLPESLTPIWTAWGATP